MAKQKLVFLIRNIHGNEFGGAEKYQIALAEELKKNGYRAIVFSSSGALRDEAARHGIKAMRAPYCIIQNWSGWRNLLLPCFVLWECYLFVWYLVKILRYRPFALHIQSRDDMVAATLAARTTKRKCFWTDHTDFRFVVWENLNRRFKNPIGKFIYRLAPKVNHITTVSQHEYDFAVNKLGVKLDNFEVVLNGVHDYLKAPKKDFEAKVGYIGRIIDYKGVGELIEAFKAVGAENKKASLHLYGTGTEADVAHYMKMAKDCPAIVFHGFTDKPMEAMADVDIFVLPSYHEGLSLSLLEATMMQKIIIASGVDGNLEIIEDKKNGLLVPPKDVEALAEALKHALDYKQSKKLAVAARKTFEEKFDFSKIVKEQIVKMYEN